nr:hypothetical protein [Tanacetum cinerariifolium]
MEGVQHTWTDWWTISAFSTQLIKCNSIREIEDAAKVTVNEPKTPDGACYLELKVPSRSRRDGCWKLEKLLEEINTPLEAVQRVVSSCRSPLMQGTQVHTFLRCMPLQSYTFAYLDPTIITNGLTRAFSTGSWSHCYKSWEKTSGVVAFIRRIAPLQMVFDMKRGFICWKSWRCKIPFDLLLEMGARVVLDTAAVPPLFLHHCDANVAKNVAAVTSTSIRNPVYKAFERGANIGDVTAKGLCVFDLNCVFNKFGITQSNVLITSEFSQTWLGFEGRNKLLAEILSIK